MNEVDEEYLVLISHLLVRYGKTERASVLLEALLVLNPDHHQARLLLAYALLVQGNYQEALSQLDRIGPAVQGSPAETLIRIRVLWGLNRLREAREIVRLNKGRLRGIQ